MTKITLPPPARWPGAVDSTGDYTMGIDPPRRCPSCNTEWTPEMLAALDTPGDAEIKCGCGTVVVSRMLAEK